MSFVGAAVNKMVPVRYCLQNRILFLFLIIRMLLSECERSFINHLGNTYKYE
jgi:hypothetical protein